MLKMYGGLFWQLVDNFGNFYVFFLTALNFASILPGHHNIYTTIGRKVEPYSRTAVNTAHCIQHTGHITRNEPV